MKISFSTIGCPDWGFKEIIATAKDFGYDGIEIRGVARDIYAPKIREFTDPMLMQSMGRLRELGLEIPIFSSEAGIFDKSRKEESLKEAKDYIDLASKAGVPYIRVLGDGTPEPVKPVDQDYLTEIYGDICDYAAGKSIDVLIETNGFLSYSPKIAEVIKNAARKNSGIIWDIHHTVRFGGEKPEFTVSVIGSWIKHVHIKDSVPGNGNGAVSYRMAGYGDIPVLEAVKELKALKYKGYLSLEWVKRWAPNLQEPGIVFPHFKYYIDQLLNLI